MILSPPEIFAATDPRVSAVALGAAPVVIARANPNRIALIFVGASGGDYQVDLSPADVATFGMLLSGPTTRLELTIRDYGALVQSEWWGRAVTVPVTARVYEVEWRG